MSRSPAAVATAVLGIGLLAAACGGSSASGLDARPIPVPANMVPSSLTPDLTTSEYTAARAKLASSGPQSLVSRGSLWQIRQGKVLAAALQVSTLKTKVDLTNNKERLSILSQVLPGAYEQIQVDGVTVAASQTTSEVFYMWFGPHLFEVLQITKTSKNPLPYEDIAAQIIQYQRGNDSLRILTTTTTTTPS